MTELIGTFVSVAREFGARQQTGNGPVEATANRREGRPGSVALTGQRVRVPTRTLNSLIAEAGLSRIDFLSIDVEGMELEALSGLDLQRYPPHLILLEDHFYNYQKHFFLRRRGYKLVRRTGYNNWYVPQEAPGSVFSVSSFPEMLRLGKKMWLNTPFNRLRRKLKQRKRGRLLE